MKKKTKIILWSSVGAVVIIGLFLWSFGFLNAVFQDKSSTLADCNDYLKMRCGDGYKCSPCKQATSGNKLCPNNDCSKAVYPFVSECVMGEAGDSKLSHDACGVISKFGYWCSGGKLWYFNSAGAKESVKDDCSESGCTDIHSGSNYKGECDAVAPIKYSGGALCVDSSYLCNKPVVLSGIGSSIGCDVDDEVYCSAGCSNGACKQASCNNDCSPNGYKECADASNFKECGNYDSDACLEWKTYSCGVGKVCDAGACKAGSAPPPVLSCDGQKANVNGVWTNFCIAGSHCVVQGSGYVCEKDVPKPQPVNVTDLCKGITCIDKCDGTAFMSQGSCDAKTGQCKYDKSEFNSANCVETNYTNRSMVLCYGACNTVDVYSDINGVCPEGYATKQLTACPPDNQTQCLEEYGTCFNIDGKNVTYTNGCTKKSLCVAQEQSFLEKYGLYLGIGVLALILLWVFLDGRNKKGGKRR